MSPPASMVIDYDPGVDDAADEAPTRPMTVVDTRCAGETRRTPHRGVRGVDAPAAADRIASVTRTGD